MSFRRIPDQFLPVSQQGFPALTCKVIFAKLKQLDLSAEGAKLSAVGGLVL